MKKTWLTLGIVGASLLVLGLILWSILDNHYVADVTVNRSFTVDIPFESFRKIMVRTDAARDIMNAGEESSLVSQHWNGHSFHLDRISLTNPDWDIEANGTLKVRINNHYLGSQVARFNQQVTIKPNLIYSVVSLEKPQGKLLGYKVTLNMSGENGKSQITQSLNLKILTPAPWFAHWFARIRVRISARQTLRAQEKHIQEAIAKHRGQY